MTQPVPARGATPPPAHASSQPSAWVQRWTHLLEREATVLDLACGYGRHTRWFAGRGHPVVSVDRSQEALDALADLAATGQAELHKADIENSPWPLREGTGLRQFGAVVVCNYLWRPLLPTITGSLAIGGVLIYETFAEGNASVGKPSRPDFLLAHGELLGACSDLRVVAYEDGFCQHPPRFVQRVTAVRAPSGTLQPSRHPID